jgi:ribose-phosphate pyrophosphokinase
VFPGGSFAKVRDSGLFTRIVCTDTHPRARELEGEGLEVLSVAPLLGEWLEGG